MDPKGRGCPREREAQERASPVPSSFTMPSPSALFCLSKALRSRTLRERKERGRRCTEAAARLSSRAPLTGGRRATVNQTEAEIKRKLKELGEAL